MVFMGNKLSKTEIKKAVALKYSNLKDAVPKIAASGKGILADKILELAEEQNIAIYKDPGLVDALVQFDIGQEIPPELYQAVAEILAFIYTVDMLKSPNSNSND